MCLRSGDGFPDVLVVDHDSKFTSEVFRAFVKGWGSCLIVGSAYHKNTNAKVERANCVVSDTLRAYANGRKDDWNGHLQLAVFAINNAASTLGGDLTPFFVDRGVHPRLPLSPPRDGSAAGESPTHCAQRMRPMEVTVLELLAAAQAEWKTKLDTGLVDTVFKVGDLVLLLTKELLDAADIGKLRPRWDGSGAGFCAPRPSSPGPGPGAPRATRRFPARRLVGGPGRDGPRRQGRALPLAGGGLGLWHCSSPQPDGRVFARGAVRPRICPRVCCGALAARRCLARPGRQLGASSR